MSEETKTPKRIRHPDRITLDSELLNVIDNHIKQATSFRKGVEISRKDYVTWRVKQLPKTLSDSELKDIADAFYDDERFLRQALNELKKARADGKQISVEELVSYREKDYVIQNRN